MKVLVLGANGRVGSKVVRRLIERGYSVAAAVHKSTENIPSGAEIRTVDISDRKSIEAATSGCDAAICALSSWSTPKHDVLETAMKTIIPVLEGSGVRRIVSISGDVARVPGEQVSLPIRLFHLVSFGPIRKVIADSEAHIQLLSESSLEWTVLRPGIMTPASKSDYTLQATHPLRLTIPRAAVVESIVDLVDSHEYARQAPYITQA